MKKSFLALAIAVLILPASLMASFEMVRNNSPRGMAMGNAIVGDPDPINGVLYNPALLAFSKQFQFQAVYCLDYLGFNTSNLYNVDGLFVIPLTYKFKSKIFKNVVLGLSFNRLGVKDSGADYLSNDELQYYEHFMSFSIAKKFENVFAYGTVFSVGINANLFQKGLTSANNNAVDLNDYFATGNLQPMSFGLDLGVTYALNKAMLIGGVIENLIPPNTAFNKTLASDKGLMSYKLALSWKLSRILFMKNVTIAGAMIFKNWEDKADIRKAPMEYHLGYEFWEFEKLLGVRLGYEWSQRGASTGFSHFSAGLACAKLFDVHEIQVDLAYQIPLYFSTANALVGTFGTVKFSLTYSWSWPQSLFEFDPQKREELRQIEELKKQYKDQEQQTKDQTQTLKKEEQAAGGAAAANLTGADAILAQANQDRNAKLLDLYNQYVRQRDQLKMNVAKLQDDGAKKMADLDKKIAVETNKYAKAKPDELTKLKQGVDGLKKQKDAAFKDANAQITAAQGQMNQLKTDTSAKRKEIEKTYDDVKKKNLKQATENFKEIPPSINLEEFRKELGEK